MYQLNSMSYWGLKPIDLINQIDFVIDIVNEKRTAFAIHFAFHILHICSIYYPDYKPLIHES